MLNIVKLFLIIFSLVISLQLLNGNVKAEEKQDKYTDFLKGGLLNKPLFASNAKFYDGSANEYVMNDFKGKFVILNFWASWCLECKENLIPLNHLSKKFIANKIDDVAIIPISLDFKSIEKLKDMYQLYNLENIGLFFDPNKEMMVDMDVHSPPKSFFIDKSGIIVYKFTNILNWNNQELYDFIIGVKDTPANEVKISPQNSEVIYNNELTTKEKSKKVTILK